MIDLYTDGSAHQNKAMQLLAQAVPSPRLRAYPVIHPDGESCIIWGARNLETAKRRYKKVYVIECGYFNDRLAFYSLGIGGLNGRADFNNDNSPPDRWHKYGFELPPWKKSGDYYLIMGQVPGDMSIDGVDIIQFYHMNMMRLSLKTDKPIYFRPHPKTRQLSPKGLKAPILGGMSLEQSFKRAAGVITYNSNSGVDAALSGVPVLTQDIGSMAWPVGAKTINELIDFNYPDRTQWAYNLAYAQWTAEELKSGEAWEHLCNTH